MTNKPYIKEILDHKSQDLDWLCKVVVPDGFYGAGVAGEIYTFGSHKDQDVGLIDANGRSWSVLKLLDEHLASA
ncbi:hypothetical protein NJB93_17870 [Brucella intermedia]|uniref:hypothetical protein n=1 Tax=Brucella intermedia TaxID=94625 RepID=UPI00209AB21A|nr:hypothetical protein [Brucella intermedia]MCO7728458.1 hypothetical protein [Brucella intermedia]